MPGTKQGAITLRRKYGKTFYARIGKKGGEAFHEYRPFEMDKKLASKAGKISAEKRKERQLT